MQLPGMSTEPVRVQLEVTWWPHDNTWSISRQGWRRGPDHQWDLEEMSVSGSPLTLPEAQIRFEQAAANLSAEMSESTDPFSEIGAFR